MEIGNSSLHGGQMFSRICVLCFLRVWLDTAHTYPVVGNWTMWCERCCQNDIAKERDLGTEVTEGGGDLEKAAEHEHHLAHESQSFDRLPLLQALGWTQ